MNVCYALYPSYAICMHVYLFSEVQTYFVNINISEELGCDEHKNEWDFRFCYIYQPIRLLKQYQNHKTKFFTKFRRRITIAGVSSYKNN